MDILDLQNSNVLVTGANGFLGQHLTNRLEELGCKVTKWHHTRNLADPTQASAGFFHYRPDYVFHLAGYNGGIQFNITRPATIFYRNTMMALNVMNCSLTTEVKKVISVVTSCAYPAFVDSGDAGLMPKQIMYENEFLDGSPHRTVECHGYAKRNLLLASKYFNQQFGLNAVTVCPTTMYGPRDSYDPERTKVVGAMVKRFVDAKQNGDSYVTCWGTGKPKRELLYVKDAAKLIVDSMLKYNETSIPLNLGTGQELSIYDLAHKVAVLVGFQGDILWDTDRPNGQSRKLLDCERMRKILGDFKPTPLIDGLSETIKDYRSRYVVRG